MTDGMGWEGRALGGQKRRDGGGRGVKMLILWDGNGSRDHGVQRQ